MNEEKDDLLAAFENPDMASVENTESAVENSAFSGTQPTVNPESVIAPEFQNAPEATPVTSEPTPSFEQPQFNQETATAETQTEANMENTAETTPETVEINAVETPVQDSPATEVDPAISVKQEVQTDDVQEDPNFLKKNIKFILIICAVIALFIIFLPKILSLLSGGAY